MKSLLRGSIKLNTRVYHVVFRAGRSAPWRRQQFATACIVALLCSLGLDHLTARAQGGDPAPGLPPTAAASPDGGQFVWWQGDDGNLWETWYSGTWNGPSNLGDGPLGSAPGATTITGQEDVFWRGTDNNLWETWYAGNWYGPANLGYGNLASAPAVGSVYSSGAQYVFWKGSNGDLWEAWYAGHWYGPADLGMGPLGSPPSVAVDSSGNQYVFWQGTDGTLREAWYTGSWYGPAIPVNTGTMGSPPSATVNGSQEQVYWAGTNGNLWEAWYSGTWNGPAQVVSTGSASMATAPATAVTNSQSDVFWWGTGALWEAWYAGNWNGPVQVFVDSPNGQQLVFYDNIGDVYSICVAGHDPYGNFISDYCWGTPNQGRNDPPQNSPRWVGLISIYQYWVTGHLYRVALLVGPIPKSQALNYWCYDDLQGGGGYGCN